MGSVFVLTSGIYSAYTIHAVFSTRGAAEQTAAAMNSDLDVGMEDYGYRVEEFALDDAPMVASREVWIDVVDGNISETWRPDSDEPVRQVSVSMSEHWSISPGYPITCRVVAISDTDEQATKMASERAFQVAAEWDIRVAREQERPVS